jgi:hypothetical protein
MRKVLCLVTLLSIFTLANPAISSVLFYDDCEDAIDTDDWVKSGLWRGNTDKKYGWIERSTEKARSGYSSYKFTLPSTDDNGCESSSCKHVQIALFAPGAGNLKYNTEYWVGFSIYFPSNFKFPSDPGYWINFFDTHQVPDTNDYPINLIDTVSSRGQIFKFRIRGDARKTTPAYDSLVRKEIYEIAPPTAGAWHDFVLNFKLDYRDSNNPFFRCYINGALVINDKGKNTSYDDKGPFMKFGLYGDVQHETIVYYDEFRFGNSGSSFSEVSPKTGGTSVEPIVQETELWPPTLSILK